MNPASNPLVPSLLATLLALSIAIIPRTAGSQTDDPFARRPVPPTQRPSEWVPSPGPWVDQESTTVGDLPGRQWRLVVASRAIGILKGGHSDMTVTYPRIRIQQIDGGEATDLAVLLPIDNRSVALFPPGDPAESAIPSERIEDTLERWPNLCSFSLLDTSGGLDLDQDRSVEVTIRRFCSCGDAGCSGIILLELIDGDVRLLDPAELVPSIRLRRVVIERLRAGEDSARPVLELLPDFMERCRFIAAVGVRGTSDCPGCCRFTILLRPIEGGRYEPYFDERSQNPLLKQMRDNLSYVAAGHPDDPLRSFEEAQIARIAAFYFLTGNGNRTRQIVLDGLGPRGRTFKAEDLLRRLDRFFLPEVDE